MEGCGEGGSLGVCDFLPLPKPLFLLGPASPFLRPGGGTPGSWGEPQSHTSRHVRHCLGKVCFGITGNKSCWYRFGSVSLPCWGRGWASGASSDPTHSETFRNGWMQGGCVTLEVGLLRSVQRYRDRERWGDVVEAGFEGGSLEPLSQHPPESKNQGLRERIQAKIKSSHCIICIIRKKFICIYIPTLKVKVPLEKPEWGGDPVCCLF